jgi:Integrase zinc binding domain
VLRWRLFLEDFNIRFHYIKGENNSFADALSRLPFSERHNPLDSPAIATGSITACSDVPGDSSQIFTSNAFHDDDLIDCFIHLPSMENLPFVMAYQMIAHAQAGDAWLPQFQQKVLATNTTVWVYLAEPNKPWKIYLPDALLPRAIQWYHLSLSHLGQSRLINTMSMTFYHPKLRQTVIAMIQKCAVCQLYKNVQRGHGNTAPRAASVIPWSEVAVDTIGPWTLEVATERVTFYALTIIDVVTNLVEIVRLDNKTSQHISVKFINTWLSRYPKPVACIYDQGGEFTGWAFQQMLN